MSESPEGPAAEPQARARRAYLSRLERLLGFELDPQHLPAWLSRTKGEHRVPVALAIIVLITLQVNLASDLVFQPWYLMPALEVALLVVLLLASPTRITRESTMLRIVGLALVGVASVATLWSGFRLARGLIAGDVDGAKDALVRHLQISRVRAMRRIHAVARVISPDALPYLERLDAT